MKTGIKFKGRWEIEHVRDGKVIDKRIIENAVVDEGLNNILDVHFHAGTQIPTWYIGLINDAVIGDLLAADTMASHAAWTEDQNYTEGTRQEWSEDAPANKQITNSVYVTFAINATTTISGIFLTSNNVKGGTTGVLWATGLFDGGNVDAVASDTLNVTYTITGAAA